MAVVPEPLQSSLPILGPVRKILSPFELLITCNPPILESLLAQVPTETIFRLYQTSSYLRDFFSKSPTSWRYISWRLQQPAVTTATVGVSVAGNGLPKQSSNYALDQIILTVINPFSTRLVSLELDNTAVSGTTLTSTVLILRRETLRHVSVRGCKNVSLKYHINPWLQMHALARESPDVRGPPGFETLALKSLYTYRCRHHRRRPYLPSSLARKESDSEPTHELVLTCHKLGIWTDTAWCTTPGARCYRRRGYVKLRMPQDPREVWVVYDRLWRSRNWLGPVEQPKNYALNKKRKRDCRSWEVDEEGMNGEAIGTGPEGKATPAHLRVSHRQFVEDITCHNCSAEILERCEQCSVMMHCVGCRKTLCASCAFDRPYLRNKNAPVEERNKFWWAPGCAVSPCSMQDQDLPPNGALNGNQNANANANTLPNIKFKWCCTEPVFSGGGGITFSNSANRDSDCIRAAPLPTGQGWDDPEFLLDSPDLVSYTADNATPREGPAGRWTSINDLFHTAAYLSGGDHPTSSVPRVLCDECYNSESWKVKCKACSTPICIKHDVGERTKARICGYRELTVEKQEFKSRQKAMKLLATLMRQRKEKEMAAEQGEHAQDGMAVSTPKAGKATVKPDPPFSPASSSSVAGSAALEVPLNADVGSASRSMRTPLVEVDRPRRPLSPASNSTGPPSRSTSPSPSTHSVTATPEPSSAPRRPHRPDIPPGPEWRGCQTLFCPPSRSTPGDHRRRCTVVMKTCMECKVYVCGDCANILESPCPCKGCRSPQSEEDHNLSANLPPSTASSETPLFFCPNCRWERMLTGKCKRRSPLFLAARSWHGKKPKKRKDKMRKPLEARRTSLGTGGNPSSTEEAIDGLVEFFTSLNAHYPGPGHPPTEANGQSQLDNGAQTEGGGNQQEIQALEDMGALARDLIRRIQRLRDQFPPGSLAALALPDIRLEDEAEVAVRLARTASDAARAMTHQALVIQIPGLPESEIYTAHIPQAPMALPPIENVHSNAAQATVAQAGHETQGVLENGIVPAGPAEVPGEEELEDEDDGHFEERESSTD
ncbi:uncharacterized protein Z520_10336 [Fonsecaea multimorphosa CBS 102226]|uniref:Uncharacterized protein n=1 Tax=Fonsecaea multimorphosa CBS 102226 TaxID=1442371 RepID=A0A0D2JU47_9EURO|nr:uncharacterized protein Z520_10336 [Fonsecaea multimorphosa CBS 102226]KIX93999.1 hypothetical protein Z520_10336 [Fonsecaea multimorphosa CBS 102226]OAL19346.1 hypothetical protein AYO22_09890 [Fonsecaea multimorphosa]